MSTRSQFSRKAAGTVIAILAIVVLAADQFTKYLVIENLEPGVATPVLGDFLQFLLVRNSGAAFSLGEGVTWIFTIALGVVALVIMYLMFTRIQSRMWAIALGALLGGVLGNLTDRIFRAPGFPEGHVVDFIYTPWMMPAIYNVADIFIVTSMVGVALIVLLGFRFDGTKEEREVNESAGEFDEDDRHMSRKERRIHDAAEAEAHAEAEEADLAADEDAGGVDADPVDQEPLIEEQGANASDDASRA